MSSASYTVASWRLESARRVSVLPQGHKCRQVHGHSFLISVFAELPTGWAPFPGGEVSELQQRLEACVAPLDYQLLNEFLAQPTDENIARWVRQRLDVPGIDRVAVQGTANQGRGPGCARACPRVAALPFSGGPSTAQRADGAQMRAPARPWL